jgi:hypothetical protein
MAGQKQKALCSNKTCDGLTNFYLSGPPICKHTHQPERKTEAALSLRAKTNTQSHPEPLFASADLLDCRNWACQRRSQIV